DIAGLTEPLRIFEGTARDAAKGFPANLNVAVALSLAGIGPDRTRLEIWADPSVTRNVHRIEVESDSARFSMTIENIPSENPKTGLITALAVIAWLRKQRAADEIIVQVAAPAKADADAAGEVTVGLLDRSDVHAVGKHQQLLPGIAA